MDGNLNSAFGSIAKGAAIMTGAFAAAVAGLSAFESNTREFRENQAKVTTSMEQAGFSAEQASAQYKEFYGIMGDSDTATEATQLLSKMATTQQDLTDWTTIATGVMAEFGDSLPLEGLVEAANETAKVGQVTGVLADALNWVGIQEDEFNTLLANTATEAGRTALITETLNAAYSDTAEAYRENNAEIIEYNKAQADMQDKMSDVGAEVLRVKNGLQEGLLPLFEPLISGTADFLEGIDTDEAVSWIEGLIDTFEDLLPVIGGVTAGFVAYKSAMLISSIIDGVKKAVAGLNTTLAANPIMAVAAAVGVLTTAFITNKNEVGKVEAQMQEISNTYKENIKTINSSITTLEAEERQVQSLIEELYALEGVTDDETTATNEAAAAHEKMSGIISTLNGLVPALASNLSVESGQLSLQRSEVDALAASYYDLAKAKAYQTAYQAKIDAAVKAQISAEEHLAELQEKRSGFSTGLEGADLDLGSGIMAGLVGVKIDQDIADAEKNVEKYANEVDKWLTTGAEFAIENEKLLQETAETGLGTGRTTAQIKAEANAQRDASLEAQKSLAEYYANQKIENQKITDANVQTFSGGSAKITEIAETEAEKQTRIAEEAAKAQFDASKKWIQEQVDFHEMSLDDEIAAWERVQARYEEGSDERIEAEENLYNLRKELYDKTEQLAQEQADEEARIIEEQKAAYQAYVDEVNSRSDQIASAFGLFSAMEEQERVSEKTLMKNLDSQLDAMEEWRENLADLRARGISDALYEEIAAGGVGENANIEALLRMDDEELAKYSQDWAKLMQMSMEQAMVDVGGVSMATALQSAEADDAQQFAMTSSGYAVPVTEDVGQYEPLTAEMVLQTILAGQYSQAQAIFDALPKDMTMTMDDLAVARGTWGAFDEVAKSQGKLFAPTRAEIAAIARSVMPRPTGG